MVLSLYSRFRGMVFMIAFALSVSGAVGQALPQDPRLHKTVLENGFTFYIYQLDSTETRTDIQLIINAGSLQETDSERGFAHFVEHMAFNGTEKFPGNTLIGILETRGLRFGSHVNAHTSFDETVYKLTFDNADAEDLRLALDVAEQWAFHVSFDSIEVEEEKGVIQEEWRSKQNEDRRLSESYLPLLFRESKYTFRQPIGDMNVVMTAESQRLRSFYHSWYRPDLMALAVVTPHDPEMLALEIKKRFTQNPDRPTVDADGQWPDRVEYRIPIYRDTMIAVNTADHLSSAEFSYFYIMPAHRQIDSEDAFARALHQQFFNSLSAERFTKVVEGGAPFRKGTTSINNLLVHHDALSGSAQLYGDELREGITSFWEEKKRIMERGFTAEEIQKFQRQYTDRLDRSLNASNPTPAQTIMERIKDDFINGNVPIGLEDRVAIGKRRIADIDSLSMMAFVKDIASQGNLILLVNVPSSIGELAPTKKELRDLLAAAKTGALLTGWKDAPVAIPDQLLNHHPKSGRIVDSMQIAELDVNVWTLENGARVYFKQTDFRKDYITMSVFRPGGFYSLDESSFLAGQHARSVIGGSGAGGITRSGLSEFLKGNSASATMVISEHREGAAASADLKDIRTMFELLYLKWTQPRLDTIVFRKAKRDLLSSVQLQPDPTPAHQLNERISKLLTRDRPTMGEVTVDRVRKEFDADRILNAYRNRFDGAEGFQFILVGDYEIEAIRSDVLKYIGGLPRGQSGTSPSGPARTATRTTHHNGQRPIHLREFGGEPGKAVVQLYLQTSTTGLHYPALLVQQVAEEALKVRLRQRLRDENAGVYSVGASISSTNVPEGILRLRISFSCDEQRYGFLIGEAYETLQEMQKDPDNFEQIIQNVKLQLTQSYERDSQRNTFWTSELRNHLYQGYNNWLYLTDYPGMLADITAEDVARFLSTHLEGALHIEAVLLPDPYQSVNNF